jgi:amino-acid N-acetyltransferase
MDNLAQSLYYPPVELPRLRVAPDAPASIRRGRVGDAPRLYEMINFYAARGDMLPRPLDYLYNRIREFHVVEAGGEVVGGAALKIIWHNLAEIMSMAVHPDFHGRSLGRRLVESLVQECRDLGIDTICTLTLRPGFFSRLGFREVPKTHLNHKIWQDCDNCSKRDCCDEVPMIRLIS